MDELKKIKFKQTSSPTPFLQLYHPLHHFHPISPESYLQPPHKLKSSRPWASTYIVLSFGEFTNTYSTLLLSNLHRPFH